MKIKDYNDMMGQLLRKDTIPPEKRAALEAKKAKAENDRKNKKRAEYGLPPLIDPNKFVELTNLYDGTNYAVDGNRKITNKQKPFKKPLLPVLKDRPVRKPNAVPPKTKSIKADPIPNIDFTPIEFDAYKTDPDIDLLKKRIDEMQEKSKQEKIKNQNSGIGYLAGGSKAYE